MFKPKEKIGIVTITKNRIKNLIPSVLTWMQVKEVERINIFDFCSDIPVYGALKRFSILDDKRIHVFRSEKKEDFHRSKFWNIAIGATNTEKILKLDSDYKLHPYFLKYHPLNTENLFYAGNWKTARVKNEMFLHGLIYARKKAFFEVGGYNERLTGYGWEDDDIYNRLKGAGYQYLDIEYDSLGSPAAVMLEPGKLCVLGVHSPQIKSEPSCVSAPKHIKKLPLPDFLRLGQFALM